VRLREPLEVVRVGHIGVPDVVGAEGLDLLRRRPELNLRYVNVVHNYLNFRNRTALQTVHDMSANKFQKQMALLTKGVKDCNFRELCHKEG